MTTLTVLVKRSIQQNLEILRQLESSKEPEKIVSKLPKTPCQTVEEAKNFEAKLNNEPTIQEELVILFLIKKNHKLSTIYF